MRTRNELKQRRQELLTVLGLVALCAALVAFGWALHGAMEAAAW